MFSYTICTNDDEEGRSIKEALAQAYNILIRSADIDSQIPIATAKKPYPLVLYSPTTSRLTEAPQTKFGRYFAYD